MRTYTYRGWDDATLYDALVQLMVMALVSHTHRDFETCRNAAQALSNVLGKDATEAAQAETSQRLERNVQVVH